MKSNHSPAETSGRPAGTVFIVDDHPVFREGLAQVIEGEEDLKVCGEAGDVEHALEAILRCEPDLVVVGITLPGKSGLELIKALRALSGGMKVLVVSMHDEAPYADCVLRAGADGYVMKQEDPHEIVSAIRDVLGGEIYVSEEVLSGQAEPGARRGSDSKNRPLAQLTDAELEVLELLGHGRTEHEIARQLHLAAETVEARCTQIRRKLKLESINALIRYAVCWVETG